MDDSQQQSQSSSPWLSGICLDHEEKWVIPPSERVRFSNVVDRVRVFYSGMAAIARKVQAAEQAAMQAAPGLMMSWNQIPGMGQEETLELLCDFDAFANRADCYVRLCRFMACAMGFLPDNKADRDKYSAAVLGDPLIWYRDKVSAHPAGATTNTRDSDAERWISCATRLDYTLGRITVGGEGVEVANSVHSAQNSRWGVTELYARMAARYWRSSSGNASPVSISDMPPQIGVVVQGGGAYSLPAVDLGGVMTAISFGKPMNPTR